MDDYARRGADLLDGTRPTPDMVRACQDTWGADLLAFLLGAGVDGPLAGWRLETAVERPQSWARLRVAYEVQQMFKDAGTARAWVRGMHDELDDQSPARLIRLGTGNGLRMVREMAERESQKT